MSFKAKLSVGGKDYNVLAFSFSMYQEVDNTGRPASVARGGTLNVEVESSAETDLFEWMCNSWEMKDGSVVFLKRDTDATLKELKFKQAYLVGYSEAFSGTTGVPMTISMTLSAQELTLGNGTHKNEWV